MKQSHRFLRDVFFASVLVSIAFAISCVELGPVPEFEYSYPVETDLPELDTASLAAENVEITEGSVDNAGAVNFSNNLSNTSEAVNYAQGASDALSQDQEDYWKSQTPSNIAAAIENGDAAINLAISSGMASFQSNSSLLALLPATIDATGALSSSSGRSNGNNGRINTILRVDNTEQTQQETLDDCRQAAQDAFEQAKDILDSLLAIRAASADLRYENQLKVVEAMRAPLEASALTRRNNREPGFLDLYNTISAAVSALFDNGDITVEQREQLEIVNLMIYAFSYQASLNLYNSEIGIITSLLAQSKNNLEAKYNQLLSDLNKTYNAELKRLSNERDSRQNSCHDQGGIHDQGGAGPN